MTNILATLMLVFWFRSGICQENTIIGDRCAINELQSGQCRLIESCPSIYNDRDKHKKRPKLCGFHGSQPIVCCTDVISLSPNVPNPVTASTSRIPTRKPSSTTTLRSPVARPNPVPSRTEPNEVNYCERFGQYVYENITIAGELSYVKENRCTLKGKDTFTSKKQVEPKEFPHMVLIGSDKNMEVRYFCAGALISDRFVLTSAHCIQDTSAKYVKVTGSSQGEYFTISEYIPYPQYTNTSFYHDIGLIKLNRPVTLSPYTRPACMPFANVNLTEPMSSFIHSTWEISGDTGIQFVKVRLGRMDKEKCDPYYRNVEALSDGINAFTQLCTIDTAKETNGCKLNLGGPLTIFHPTTYCSYLLLGVSSFAKSCGFSQSPLVFTDIRPYMSWIEQTVFSSV